MLVSGLGSCLSVRGAVSRLEAWAGGRCVLGSVPLTAVPIPMRSLCCMGQLSQGVLSSYTPDSALKWVGDLGNREETERDVMSQTLASPGLSALRSLGLQGAGVTGP